MNVIQRIAFAYSVIFFSVVLVNAIPFIHDEQGLMFGLFKLDLIDDLLHLGSALWALVASLHSARQSIVYFKVFGIFYVLDGIICFLFGQCLLDVTIITHVHEVSLVSFTTLFERTLINVPHLVLGAIAVYVGFRMSPKYRV